MEQVSPKVDPSHTTGIVAGGEQDTARGLSQSNDVAGSGRRENAVLADEEFLDAVCSTDLCDQLNDLRVPETAVTTDDKEGACTMC